MNISTKIQVDKIITYEPQTLPQLLETIFSDLSIYNDAQLKNLVMEDPQGFVDIETILQLQMSLNFRQNHPQIYVSVEEVKRQCLESKKLLCVDFRIRRLCPFQDRIATGEYKPVYVERLPPGKSAEEIILFFSNIVKVFRIYYKKSERWAIIVVDDWQTLEKMEEIQFQNQNVPIKSPEVTLTIYEQCVKMDSDFRIRNLYKNKKVWEIQPLDKEIEEEVARYQNTDQMPQPNTQLNLNDRNVIGNETLNHPESDQEADFHENDMHAFTENSKMTDFEEYRTRDRRHREQELKRIIKKQKLLAQLPKYNNSALLALRQH